MFTVMTTWRRGREVMVRRLSEASVPLQPFLKSLFTDPPQRVPGTAIFLTATPDATPHALLHNLNHNKVLHERVVFLTVEIRDVPWVSFEERVTCELIGHGYTDLYMQVWGMWFLGSHWPHVPTHTVLFGFPDGMPLYAQSVWKGGSSGLLLPWLGVVGS